MRMPSDEPHFVFMLLLFPFNSLRFRKSQMLGSPSSAQFSASTPTPSQEARPRYHSAKTILT